jgi:hypothetical protein
MSTSALVTCLCCFLQFQEAVMKKSLNLNDCMHITENILGWVEMFQYNYINNKFNALHITIKKKVIKLSLPELHQLE